MSTLRKPVTKAARGSVRSPRPALVSVTTASSASSGAMASLAGLAVMMLPAMVARLRICGAPTSQHARASGKALSTISGLATHWLCVTSGPRWIMPPCSSISARPGMRVRSITPGTPPAGVLRTPRSISSRRSVAPAMMRAAAP